MGAPLRDRVTGRRSARRSEGQRQSCRRLADRFAVALHHCPRRPSVAAVAGFEESTRLISWQHHSGVGEPAQGTVSLYEYDHGPNICQIAYSPRISLGMASRGRPAIRLIRRSTSIPVAESDDGAERNRSGRRTRNGISDRSRAVPESTAVCRPSGSGQSPGR